jgi:hypothetical protein
MTHDELLNDPGSLLPQRSNQGRETKAITDTRRAHVLKMYSDLKPREEIIAWVVSQGYTRSCAIQDLHFARDEWKALLPDEETPQHIIARHLNAYYTLYNRALADGETATAAKMLQAVEKLLGLHAPGVQVNVLHQTNNNTQNNVQLNLGLDNLSLEDLQQLRAIRAKMLPPDA